MNNQEVQKAPPLEGFGEALQQKGIIPRTIQRHGREVNRLAQWLQTRYHTTVESTTQKQLIEYLQYAKENRQLCNATQNSILQMLKNYFSFLAQTQGIPNIAAFIQLRGIHKKKLQYVFTPDELELLCDNYYHFIRTYIPTKKETYWCSDYEKLLQGRYIALTLIAYQGLQLQEIERLTKNDFDLRKGIITIQQSRKGAARKLVLEPLQIGALIQYYTGEEMPLMPNRNHFEHLNLSLKSLHEKYKDFRQLRASKITHWLKLHGLRKAQYLAGHKNIHNTEKYLAADVETLQNDMANFHPLR